jgi:transcriptional regulator with XRE-family HTH domain
MNSNLDLSQVADILSKDDPTISGDLLARLRQEMGLNRVDFARMVGLSERSVANWEAGTELKESSLRTIVEVGRLYAKLRQSFASPEQLATWLKTPNQAFGGSQPLQVIERGEIDRIWRMIYFLESGSPS